MKTIVKGLFWAAVLLLAGLLIAGTSGFSVKTGNVGLIVNHLTGRIDPNIRHAGFNPQFPLSGNELIEIPTYYRTYTMVQDSTEGAHTGDDSVMVNTASSNTLHVDTSITYHINFNKNDPHTIIALYEKYRQQFQDFDMFEDQQLRPIFRQAIVDAFGRMATSQCMTGDGKRSASAYALAALNTRLNPDSIVVDEVRIRTVYPDDATLGSLRSRLQAQQNLRLAQLNLQLQQIVNQRQVLAAEATAEATRIKAASLSDRLVRFKHIQNIEIVGVPKGTIISVPSDEQPAGE
jgi:regulator of protease activity HflC (stomatin/prohibitin superfamily)